MCKLKPLLPFGVCAKKSTDKLSASVLKFISWVPCGLYMLKVVVDEVRDNSFWAIVYFKTSSASNPPEPLEYCIVPAVPEAVAEPAPVASMPQNSKPPVVDFTSQLEAVREAMVAEAFAPMLNIVVPVEEATIKGVLFPAVPTTASLAAGVVVLSPIFPELTSVTKAYLLVIVPFPVGAAMYCPYKLVIVPVENVNPLY